MALTKEQLAVVAEARTSSGGRLPAGVVARLVADGLPMAELMLGLVPMAQKHAIPPISNFFVGAIALGESGALYFGANYEFPGQALSFTVHAEQAVVTEALGYDERGIRMLAVSAPPCGYCRQFLNELTTAAELQILLPDKPAARLTDLLPNAFGPSDLGIASGLMSPQDHQLVLVETLDPASKPDADPLIAAALAAANKCYAPYSSSYAGVALRAKDGSIYSGSLAENAAFNPTMSPIEAAIVRLAIDGGHRYGDITDAVLVEVQGASVSQVAATRAVLSGISSVPLRVYDAVAG
jgi:cytidine deaminase